MTWLVHLYMFTFSASVSCSSGFNIRKIVHGISPSCLIILYRPIDATPQDIFVGNTLPLFLIQVKLTSTQYKRRVRQIQWKFVLEGKYSCVFNLLLDYKSASWFRHQEPRTWLLVSSFGLNKRVNHDYVLIVSNFLSVNDVLKQSISKRAMPLLYCDVTYISGRFHLAFLIQQGGELFLLNTQRPCGVFYFSSPLRTQKVDSISRGLFNSQVYIPNDKLYVEQQTGASVLVCDRIRTSSSVEFKFLRTLFGRTNSTTLPNCYSAQAFVDPTICIDCVRDYSNSFAPSVYFSTKTVNALTCYTSPVLSFRMYLQPFDTPTWAFILLTGLFLCLLFRIYLYVDNIEIPNFNMVLFYMRTLTEDPIELPECLHNFTLLRIVLVVWLFESAILLSLYTSKLISDLNAPLQGIRIENLSQVYCRPVSKNRTTPALVLKNARELLKLVLPMPSNPEFYSGFIQYNVLLGESEKNLQNADHSVFAKIYNPDCFSFLSPPDQNLNPNHAKQFIPGLFGYTLIWRVFAKIVSWACAPSPENAFAHKMLSVTSRFTRHFPREWKANYVDSNWSTTAYIEAAIEDELVKCEKSIYFSENIDRELDYLNTNYRRRAFYKLKEKLDSRPVVWLFMEFGEKKMLRTTKLLIEAGIYQIMEREIQTLHYLTKWKATKELPGFKSDKLVSPISLGSSVQSVFFIYLLLTEISFLVIVFEVLSKVGNQPMWIYFRL